MSHVRLIYRGTRGQLPVPPVQRPFSHSAGAAGQEKEPPMIPSPPKPTAPAPTFTVNATVNNPVSLQMPAPFPFQKIVEGIVQDLPEYEQASFIDYASASAILADVKAVDPDAILVDIINDAQLPVLVNGNAVARPAVTYFKTAPTNLSIFMVVGSVHARLPNFGGNIYAAVYENAAGLASRLTKPQGLDLEGHSGGRAAAVYVSPVTQDYAQVYWTSNGYQIPGGLELLPD